MLRTHYRQPIDWTVKALEDAEQTLLRWSEQGADAAAEPDGEVLAALEDDLNTPAAIARLHRIESAAGRAATLDFLGFSNDCDAIRTHDARVGGVDDAGLAAVRAKVEKLFAARLAARAAKDWSASDRLRAEISALGVEVRDSKDGSSWEFAR